MTLVAIHAHLYQPPRENPWSETIEPQPSAAPLHDWNERVSQECYERLGRAAVRGPRRRIERVVNLFARLSVDIGPTLAAWLARERPEVLEDALEGDLAARARQQGAGAALMQPYGHPILPLCAPRERDLQLAWGLADFRARFGRDPLGAWLPECAVDGATVEACVKHGLRYTVLAPEQIAAVRPLAGGEWRSIEHADPPTDRPLVVRAPAGAELRAFVFHGDLSRRLAFGGLMDSAPGALAAIRDAAGRGAAPGGLVLLAADGETFGHHQRGADERLARLVTLLDADERLELVTLDAALARLEPTHEARLVEPSAWSCSHGVGRWERACGCASRPRPASWSFAWREDLRGAVRGLVESACAAHGRDGGTVLRDPWDAARRLGEVLAADRPAAALDALLDATLASGATPDDRRRAAASLEMVRQALFAATSCGWFFDDVAGIEARQVLRHAARACELGRAVHGIDLETGIVAALSSSPANAARAGTSADVFLAEARDAPRRAGDAALLHAIDRWADGVDGVAPVAPAGTERGGYLVEETSTPVSSATRPDRPRDTPDAGAIPSLTARLGVRHVRTQETSSFNVRILVAPRTHLVAAELDGEPVDAPVPPVRAALVDASARLAARAIGRDVGPHLGQLGRIAALGKGLPLPAGLLELSRGIARVELGRVLRAPPDGTATAARDVAQALRRARAAGADDALLADIAPRLNRMLGALTERALATGDDRALGVLARACRLAGALVGDPALVATRRALTLGPLHRCGPQALALAKATMLEPSALPPADTPARPRRDPTDARA